MHETGVSEEVARNYIQYLCGLTWKKMNKIELQNLPYLRPLLRSQLILSGWVSVVTSIETG